MKKRSTTRVFSVLAALSAFVAIMCMFANLFSEEIDSAEGNVFVAMFGMKNSTYGVVWPLVIAFVLLILLVIVGFFGLALGDAGAKFIPLLVIVLGLAAGILFFFPVAFYQQANPWWRPSDAGYASLGAGSICVIVFSFLSAALGLFNLLVDHKSE